ncbi:MAG: transposase [Planctomycetia bacterium]|nr:transposase [Planctomycetia bacterium]
MEQHELTKELWEKIRPFLPEQNRGRGRRWLDLRTYVNGVEGIPGTGIPWQDLPERYGTIIVT